MGADITVTVLLSLILASRPDVRLIQLVIECETYGGKTKHHLMRNDN